MDTAQNTARAAAGGFGDRRLRGARRPLAITEKYAALYTIGYSTPAERGRGVPILSKGRSGVLEKPRWLSGTLGAEG